jgi:hypothetical protein
MRKAVLVLLSALALVLGLAVSAGAAAKPAYKVTLKTSVAKSTAERFITVSGKVTGPKAAGKSVTIQRHYVGGPWITVASATIRSNGKYAARVETPRGGTTSFRALKPKSSARKAGVSATRSIPVYEWLNLASQSSLHDTFVQPGIAETLGGKTAPSIIIWGNTDLQFKLGGLCTTVTTGADYQDSGATESVDLNFYKWPTNGGSSTQTSAVVTKGTPATVTTSLVGQRVLGIEATNFDSGFKLVIFNPRVLCNASSLPAWTENELK